MNRSLFLLFLFAQIALLAAVPPEEAKKKLIEGNLRYTQDKGSYCDHSSDRRQALVSKQKPFAAIVACSDSRVAPEIIFDQGLGDLFVVRVAGNVAEELELNSIAYAVTQLQTSFVLVVGHENCGALQAVLEGKAEGFPALNALISPAIKGISSTAPHALKEAILANVRYTVERIKRKSHFKPLIESGALQVVGGYYSLDTGAVEFLP